MRTGFAVPAALAFLAGAARAQCKVASSSNEGKLLAFYTAPIIFSAATAPRELGAGEFRVGVEAEYIPKPGAELQKSGTCFLQKSENTSLSPVFGRPRITIGLPGSFAIEGSYLPPVKIADARPNLGSIAISHTHHFNLSDNSGSVDVMVRGNTTFGDVKGPITCPRSALQITDRNGACYGTNPSNDTFSPDMYGIDVIAGVRPPTRRFGLYGGVGANRIAPHFQVGFTDGAGNVDRTKVQLETPLTRISLTAGVTAHPGSQFDVGAQVYSVPQDATTVRFHAGISFR